MSTSRRSVYICIHGTIGYLLRNVDITLDTPGMSRTA